MGLSIKKKVAFVSVLCILFIICSITFFFIGNFYVIYRNSFYEGGAQAYSEVQFIKKIRKALDENKKKEMSDTLKRLLSKRETTLDSLMISYAMLTRDYWIFGLFYDKEAVDRTKQKMHDAIEYRKKYPSSNPYTKEFFDYLGVFKEKAVPSQILKPLKKDKNCSDKKTHLN